MPIVKLLPYIPVSQAVIRRYLPNPLVVCCPTPTISPSSRYGLKGLISPLYTIMPNCPPIFRDLCCLDENLLKSRHFRQGKIHRMQPVWSIGSAVFRYSYRKFIAGLLKEAKFIRNVALSWVLQLFFQHFHQFVSCLVIPKPDFCENIIQCPTHLLQNIITTPPQSSLSSKTFSILISEHFPKLYHYKHMSSFRRIALRTF